MAGKVVVIRHGDDPPDDRVYTYFQQNGFEVDLRKPFKGEEIGTTDGIVGSVFHGGPFNVFDTDKHPFLNDEHHWIEKCIEQNIPLLGICQGAQSIAYVLGARAGPLAGEPHEFGYYTVYPTESGRNFLPDPIRFVQAHFHEFGIPDGGELLAYSDAFPNQAFRYGENTYGIQYHPEVTIEGFRRWQKNFDFYYGKPGVQSKAEQDELMLSNDEGQADWFYGFMGQLFPSAHE